MSRHGAGSAVAQNTTVIIDQAVYRGGKRIDCGDLHAGLADLREHDHGFLWVGLKDPTAGEFSLIATELGLHPLAVEDALGGGQRPKFEVYDGMAFLVMRTLRYIEATSDVETGELMVFVGDRFVVTVRRGEPTPLETVRAALEHDPRLLEKGPVAVIYSVMDAVVDKYLAIDEELSDDVLAIEHQVVTPSVTTDVSDIYELKRELLEARWAVQPLIEPTRRLVASSFVDEGFAPFFRDVLDHLQLVSEHIETYDRLLSDVLSAYLSQVGVQQNNDMRKISAWVAIATVPTMLAGIYGTNFHSVPELEASVHFGGRGGGYEFYYGYYLMIAVLATIGVLLWRAFKKSGWL